MYENEKGTKLVGIIDLVVVDKQGNVRIYDFKTSLKNDAFWSPSKAFRMT
jgi:RecB family exonuclease